MDSTRLPEGSLDTVPMSSSRYATRTVSFCGERDLIKKASLLMDAPSDPIPSEARLLLSVSSIAENEIRAMGGTAIWDDVLHAEDNQEGTFRRLRAFPRGNCSLKPSAIRWRMRPRLASPMDDSYFGPEDDEDEEDASDSTYDGSGNDSPGVRETANRASWNHRARSVSIDSPESPTMEPSVLTFDLTINGPDPAANIVSPLNSPVLVKASKSTCGLRQTKKRQSQSRKAKRDRRQKNKKQTYTKKNTIFSANTAGNAEDAKKPSLKAVSIPKGKAMKKILRKKFSWKNYPEVSPRAFYCGDNTSTFVSLAAEPVFTSLPRLGLNSYLVGGFPHRQPGRIPSSFSP